MSLPLLLLICSIFIKKNNSLINAIYILNITFIIANILISISDIGLYSAWGTKLNSKAIAYLAYPKEALGSFASVPYWKFICITIIECFLFIFIYRKVFKLGFFGELNIYIKIIFPIIIIFLLFTAIRGGYGKRPISKGSVYFSKHAVLNYSATNSFWNFMEIFVNPEIKDNPYKYFSQDKAEKIMKAMSETSMDSTEMILTTTKPNIVLILMESVSAECLGSLDSLKGIMPGLDSLTKDGLLFTNFYANGFRTEQGIIAYLSSFPAQPQTSILRKFGKFEKLPNMAKLLGDNGYSENYYYSGNIEFANTGPYLRSSGFSNILGQDNYNWVTTTDWGAYDEELFACHLKEATKDHQPFFSIIMTSTSHEPFNANVEKIYKGNNESDNYRNTVHYTGNCIYDYLQKAKSQPWYNNTLFIITSDHAHSYPCGRGANEIKRHWIPLLFYGNVLKPQYKGKRNEHIGSQIDLAASLLSQLKMPYKQFVRSKNIFNKYSPEFAFYTFDNGFGIITPKQSIVFDHNLGQIVFRKNQLSTAIDNEITDQGKAYLQLMFEEYIRFNN